MASTDEPATPPRDERVPEQLSSRHLLRRLLGFAIFGVIVILVVAELPGLGELRHRFAGADVWFVGLIAVCKLGSCLSNVVAFRDVFTKRAGWRFSYLLSLAEQGTNVLVPTGGAGGLALGAWALRDGMSTEQLARRSVSFFVLTSIPNFACAAVLGPLLLAGVFAGSVPVAPTAVFTGLAWLTVGLAVLLARLLTHIDPNSVQGTWGHRIRAAALILGQGLVDTWTLIRERRWQAILGAFGYLGFDITALVMAFAAFGHVASPGPLIFAYVIGQLGGLIPLPAGIGGIDGGIIGALVLYGSSLTQATAADFAYHTCQFGVPAILGTIAFIRLRHVLAVSGPPLVEPSSSTAAGDQAGAN